jgi:hypothetical protein
LLIHTLNQLVGVAAEGADGRDFVLRSLASTRASTSPLITGLASPASSAARNAFSLAARNTLTLSSRCSVMGSSRCVGPSYAQEPHVFEHRLELLQVLEIAGQYEVTALRGRGHDDRICCARPAVAFGERSACQTGEL